MTDRPWQKIYDQLGMSVPAFDDRPLGAYIQEHAQHRPDALALQYFDRSFSYAEVDILSNKLANALSDAGLGRGDVVGIHLPNTPQYIFALIAISKMGAIGSGVSPLLAPPEIAHQIKDAGMKALITLSDLAPAVNAMPSVPPSLALVITAGAGDFLGAPPPTPTDVTGATAVSYQAFTEQASGTFDQRATQPHDTFMIQYTGGTTGRPKGAELSIRTLLHNPRQVAQGDPDTVIGDEVYASAFPYFHIAGLSFALGGLIFGAQSMVFPNPRDVDNLCKLMAAFPPTRIAAVPALYDALSAHEAFKSLDFSRLKVAKTGGAPMTSTTRKNLEAVIGANTVSDVFGMTETGPCYTCHPLPVIREGSVGIAVPGADIKIMDVETGTREMPVGEPGEICSSGPQTMKGYLNLPEESAHALREMDGRRWMYSGDIGYMDADGYVFLCDRAKDMLIVGGYKVFSVEVEDKLKALPMIAESAVIGTPDPKRPGNDVVNLYVQLAPAFQGQDASEIAAEIEDFMRANMAPYKVAKHIHIIDEIPLTPVGKIDKKALRA